MVGYGVGMAHASWGAGSTHDCATWCSLWSRVVSQRGRSGTVVVASCNCIARVGTHERCTCVVQLLHLLLLLLVMSWLWEPRALLPLDSRRGKHHMVHCRRSSRCWECLLGWGARGVTNRTTRGWGSHREDSRSCS